MITTPAIAPTVAGLARNHGVDVVMTGVQTSEDLRGQAASFLAGMLGWAHVSGTNHVAANADGMLIVSQERESGIVAKFRLAPPAVLGVQTASKPPRYASGTKLREAARSPIRCDRGCMPHASNRRTETDAGGCAEQLGSSPQAAPEKLARILVERGLVGSAP